MSRGSVARGFEGGGRRREPTTASVVALVGNAVITLVWKMAADTDWTQLPVAV